MTRRIFSTNKNGFSLIELCIVLAILAILAGSITPVFIKRIQVKAGEKTAVEMSVIQQAASAYFVANNAWPANLAALQNAGYLNPSWVTNNPWQNAYAISSTASSFTVSTTLPQEWTNLVARDLPTSSVSGNSVSSTVPAPGSTANQSLPVGAIIMWSDTLGSIPTDWQLCDGTNGTPDLRDRFIVGAGKSYSIGANGGEVMHILTIAEMPAHTHPNTTYSSDIAWTPNIAGASTNVVGSRATGSAGGGQAHENRPPYYALCFIMKMQ